MKYIILLGSEATVEYDSKVDAVQAYNEYIAVEGDYHDFTLCEVLETHEAPEREVGFPGIRRHYKIDLDGHWGYSEEYLN